MAEYLQPGVYVEEKAFSTPPATSGSSSTGAFVGFMPRGNVGEPTLVTSWTDFVNKFALGVASPFMKDSYLAYAMYGFFNNGGKRAYVVRATDGTDGKASVSVANGTDPINFVAKDAGVWANGLKIDIAVNADAADTYDVSVKDANGTLETFAQLGLADDAANSFVGVINQNSKFIEVDTAATSIDPLTSLGEQLMAGGSDGLANVTPANLIEAMKKFDLIDQINLLVMPESQASEVALEATAYAEQRGDAFFVADAAMNDDIAAVQDFKKLLTSDFGGLYYPWVEVVDPIGKAKKTRFVPTAGHVAGEYARTDSERGVFKAPAGIQADLRGVVGVKTKVNDQEQAILNPKGINVIRVFPDAGIVVWGARTMAGGYINVRRELNYIMGTILQSTKWAVFEPNNADLWRKIGNQLTTFLQGRQDLGAYHGFFVKCDGELNTQAEIDAGRVNTEVGVSIHKPGEFVIFRVGQWDGGGSVA